jgi:hypothetical protein
MSYDSIKIEGREYVNHASWSFGDYIGLENIRYIVGQCEGHVIRMPMEALSRISEGDRYGLYDDEAKQEREARPWAIELYGDYSSRTVWVRKAIACRLSSHGYRGDTWIEHCERYPSLEPSSSSEIKAEWKSFLKYDLLRILPGYDDDTGLWLKADGMSDDDLFSCYFKAIEDTNTYPEAYADVESIAASFVKHVENWE